MLNSKLTSMNKLIFLALLLAILSTYLNNNVIFQIADIVSQIFLKLLKLISLPIIFLSIVSSISGLKGLQEIKSLGKNIITYTISTTLIAATIGLVIFLIINPVNKSIINLNNLKSIEQKGSIFDHLLNLIPSNLIQAFLNNNVIGIVLIAFLLGLSILNLKTKNKKLLSGLFTALFESILKITNYIILLLPIAIWAFITLFIKDLYEKNDLKQITWYVVCVISANLIQATIALPALLKWKGISPIKVFKGMKHALVVAFFSKSSSATLPITIKCIQENLKVSQKISKFSLPFCATVNMNACAAFILITVLFVSQSNGYTYTPVELIGWIFLATLAAIGNAAVPLGCYFMATTFLIAMNVPLHIMGLILPIYLILDMLETSINVWSDACITTIVDKKTVH